MKKVKISIAAIALVFAIAGTATANANKAEAEPCSQVDPNFTVCLNQSFIPCCEDDFGNLYYERARIEPNSN
jgi:hypothetical protein